ncbi:MAG TPA: BNR-4 repeat-containing protein [Pirellulaceae bacterium]|jgi:hypothetical protein|nr:BNR-4 repeat-containing protein [Pirellulaceae bacterium]
MKRQMTIVAVGGQVLAVAVVVLSASARAEDSPELPSTSFTLQKADGFRGLWYQDGDYYTGGLGTFPQQIRPYAFFACDAGESGMTFFTYGGATENDARHLQHMISYYDHASGQVARPRILLDKATSDGHDNPAIMLDDDGYIYIFSNAHGRSRPSFIHRSTKPFAIDEFAKIVHLPPGPTNFSYSQPWYLAGQGFLFVYTHYESGGASRRHLHFNTSVDGIHWNYNWGSRPVIAKMPRGHYQISQMNGHTVGTAFNCNVDINRRTNLYYMETSDMGRTWKTAGGMPLDTPLTSPDNAALAHDYMLEKRYVYLKNIQYDAKNQPVILYLTTSVVVPEISSVSKTWHTAHWSRDQAKWVIRDAFTSDQNYDHGPLYIEDDGTWRIIAPTDPGPTPLRTGGGIVMWISQDEGATWQKTARLTPDSQFNHSYVRQPVHAHADFYAFWADGNAEAVSPSSLYFTDKHGSGVWRLPSRMDTDLAKPALAFTPAGP